MIFLFKTGNNNLQSVNLDKLQNPFPKFCCQLKKKNGKYYIIKNKPKRKGLERVKIITFHKIKNIQKHQFFNTFGENCYPCTQKI